MSRIMVVDDEAIITTQLQERLTSMGYEVVGRASSGEKSIDMAKLLKPDLILMDIVMPGKMDGIDASEIIRTRFDIPVIFLTAYTDDELIKRAKDAGPYGYILKPFQERELKAAIEVALHRKDWERLLSESEERYRSVVDHAEEAIISTDNQGNIVSWNHAAEKMFGYPAQEIIDKPATSMVPERFHKNLRRVMERAISKGVSFTIGKAFEFYGLRKDGSEFPLELSVTTWETRGGVFLTGIMRDITERKQMEEALRKSEQTIRQLARTFVQSHEEERQQVSLEVHDRIAQTLTAALLQLQALEAITQEDAAARKMLLRAIVLVQESITESRNIMQDLYSPVLRDFGLVATIDEELHSFREDTDCRTKFDARCPGRLPRDVEATAYRIFHEALSNVRRHAASAREVNVSLTCKDRMLTLEVRDDGPGFDPWAEMQIKQVGGLMIMRRRAELNGGSFEVISAPGQGATVTVRLPYA